MSSDARSGSADGSAGARARYADLIARLRAADLSGYGQYSALVRDAADAIETLTQGARAEAAPPSQPNARQLK